MLYLLQFALNVRLAIDQNLLLIQRRQRDVSHREFFGPVVIPEFAAGQFQRHHIALVRTTVYTRKWPFALAFGPAAAASARKRAPPPALNFQISSFLREGFPGAVIRWRRFRANRPGSGAIQRLAITGVLCYVAIRHPPSQAGPRSRSSAG